MELMDSLLLSSYHNADLGPEAKENNLLKADEEYRNNRLDHSIYYQVRAQFHSTDLRYLSELEQLDHFRPNIKDLLANASGKEQKDYKRNKFFQNILVNLKDEKRCRNKNKKRSLPTGSMTKFDFLEDIRQPSDGWERITDICRQLPNEWCVIQLTKSYNPSTTYSLYNEIASSKGSIYLAMLRHCRSPELEPTCLKVTNERLVEVFQEYSTLVERFRRVVNVDPILAKNKETKRKYWVDLHEFGKVLEKLIADLREIILPYAFLFLGKRYATKSVTKLSQQIFREVDEFCEQHKWNQHQRIILSQAAYHANHIKKADIAVLSWKLASDNEEAMQLVEDLLNKWSQNWEELKELSSHKRFPTILIVDERLDHFHWEQLATTQEFSRVKSLHLLWRLYQWHKPNIHHGYYTVNIESGISVINPDGDLPNSGRRLRGFFEYWLGHWRNMFETVPTEDVIVKEVFKSKCFVYAGHGSGLQYISGRTICRCRVEGIVFLFGCDSTKILGTGLHSALYGSHDYYHGALCPTIVGTLMPALDSNIDNISSSILSKFLAPSHRKVMPWSEIDTVTWVKKGLVQAQDESNPQYLDQYADYQMGSLPAIISRVQQGLIDPVIFNCCIYVCRGLPAWNLSVQKMPF
uniref:separase n=1 Tax=Drosophila willistoni TaxID=7260 RepID=Q6V3V6_DROWI|nr:separase [Drosophila willistoni]